MEHVRGVSSPTEKLSEKERRFIVAATLSADASVKQIAESLEMREHSVRYIRDGLLTRGVIRPVFHSNHFRLGLNDFGIYLSRGSENSAGRKRFETQLERTAGVFWVAKTGGSYQYAVSFATPQTHRVGELFSTLRPSESGTHFDKSFGIRMDWTIYPPTYLTGETRRRDRVTFLPSESAIKIDDLDRKVLRALSDLPSKTVVEYARVAGTSPSSFAYRMEQLREHGILYGRRYVLETQMLGISNHRLLIVDRGLTPNQREELFELCSKHPNVVAFLRCTGDWDFELRFESERVGDIDVFCQLLFDTFGNGIGSLKTMQQLRILKQLAFPG
jgi:DNA-binding Lrp family transcriptional regulator